MKNLKLFEDFVDDIMKSSSPSKPIERMDLTGSVYDNRNLPQLEVKYAVEFVPSGTFGAISNAQNYLKDMGYQTGSMEGEMPIGFADENKYGYVSKWTRMNRSEHGTLDGAIIPDPEFREGGVLVLFFTSPKF
jgi:hypothetical protein